MNKERVSELIRELIIEIGEDPEREGLKRTLSPKFGNKRIHCIVLWLSCFLMLRCILVLEIKRLFNPPRLETNNFFIFFFYCHFHRLIENRSRHLYLLFQSNQDRMPWINFRGRDFLE